MGRSTGDECFSVVWLAGLVINIFEVCHERKSCSRARWGCSN